jgi:hypothetical protein
MAIHIVINAETEQIMGCYFDLSKAGICLVGEFSKEAEKVKQKWR